MARENVDDDTEDWDQAEFWRRQAHVPTDVPAEETWQQSGEAPPTRRPRRAMSAAVLLLLLAGAVGLAVSIGRSGPAAVPLPPAPSLGSDVQSASPPSSADGAPTPSAVAESSAPSSPKPLVRAELRPTSTTSARPAVVRPQSGLVVRIVSVASGKPFGVARASLDDGAPIIQVSQSTSNAQLWRLETSSAGCFDIVNLASLKALDAPEGTTNNGVQMQQWTLIAGNPNQSWCFDPHSSGQFLIRNVTNGLALDLRDGGGSDGAAIQQWGADLVDPNENQRWRLTLP